MVQSRRLVRLEQGKMNVKNYMALGSLFFAFFFFHPMMYFVHAIMRACLFAEGEGYHMRMRTGQLPTKMDDAQDHIPPPYTHHIEDELSSGGQTTKRHGTDK